LKKSWDNLTVNRIFFMVTIKENNLSFYFPNTWKIMSYDKIGGFYSQHIDTTSIGIKAVDIIASNGSEHLWIEIKDCLEYENTNFPRLSPQPIDEVRQTKNWIKDQGWQGLVAAQRKKPYIVDEFSQKVLHTFIGIVSASKVGNKSMVDFSESIEKNTEITVVLFLTLDIPDYKRLAMRLQDAINKKLSKFKIRVSVCNEDTIPKNSVWSVKRK
jgi:hypothetical protein